MKDKYDEGCNSPIFARFIFNCFHLWLYMIICLCVYFGGNY